MTTPTYTNTIGEIADKYGMEQMREVWIEELLELATKLQQQKRKFVKDEDIITEIADVSFCLDQMAFFYDSEKIAAEKEFKINRTAERLL